MPTSPRPTSSRGRWTADMIEPKSAYELSGGERIEVMPTGNRGGEAQTWGAAVIATDPLVHRAGTDVGYSPEPGTLRAPDISVIPTGPSRGWVKGVPPLAVEYADVGQDEPSLQAKIGELLAGGTLHLWVVRLGLDQRVEVYRKDGGMEVRRPGELLDAPGVLSAPIRVEALFDPRAALPRVVENALRRMGFEGGLDGLQAASREEGKIEGKIEGRIETLRQLLVAALEQRGTLLDEAARTRLDAEVDPETLQAWCLVALRGENPLA